jgi:hypothetical protein
MARFNEHHSFSATVREGKGGYFIRIIDRYWPGGPSPEYGTLLNLEPWEAMSLGKELIEAAKEAKRRTDDADVKLKIRKQTETIAAAAKEEALG